MNRSPKILRLMIATGLSHSSVYKYLRAGRKPRNAVMRAVWDRTLRGGP